MKIKVAVEFEVNLPDIEPNTAEYLYEDRIEDIAWSITEDIKDKYKNIKGTGNFTYIPEDDKDYRNGTLYDE